MRIAHYGTFDVYNYGDLLFPIVAREHLGAAGAAFSYVSPKGGPGPCADAVETISIAEAASQDFEFDAALIGGGNIITFSPTNLPDYASRQLSNLAYPGLWLSACMKSADIGAAIAWNAPGTGQINSLHQRGILLACAANSDYVAFRESSHIPWLIGRIPSIQIIPDTAISLSKIWPRESLSDAFDAVRLRFSLPADYCIIHLKQRNLAKVADLDIAVDFATKLSEDGLMPVLLPLGLCHGDDAALLQLSRRLKCDHRLVIGQPSIREVTALIAHSRYVFTASLHGAIVSTAYGIKCNLMGNANLPKYRAFFEQLDLAGVVWDRWTDIENNSARLSDGQRSEIIDATEGAQQRVERHFRSMADAIANRKEPGKRGDRLRRSIKKILDQHSPLSNYLPVGALFS